MQCPMHHFKSTTSGDFASVLPVKSAVYAYDMGGSAISVLQQHYESC